MVTEQLHNEDFALEAKVCPSFCNRYFGDTAKLSKEKTYMKEVETITE